MLKLINIMESLKAHPRQLTDEESLYLIQLGMELDQAQSDAGRWRILEREGLNRIDGMDFSDETLKVLSRFQRASLN